MFSTDRYDRLPECVIECLQKLGQSGPDAYFYPLILLFKGYIFLYPYGPFWFISLVKFIA